MSAFVHGKDHIGALIQFARTHAPELGSAVTDLPLSAPASLGNLLHTENILSVAYRYEEPPVKTFRFTATDPFTDYPRLTVIEALKAAHSLDYQSCEHPGWETSEGRKWLLAFVWGVVSLLPEYGHAQGWTVYRAA